MRRVKCIMYYFILATHFTICLYITPCLAETNTSTLIDILVKNGWQVAQQVDYKGEESLVISPENGNQGLKCCELLKILRESRLPYVFVSNKISGDDVEALDEVESIEEIRLTGDLDTDVHLGDLNKLKHLKRIDLQGCPAGDLDISELGKISTLEEISLRTSMNISSNGLHHLAVLKRLRHLKISCGNPTQQALTGLLSSQSLESIYLYFWDNTDEFRSLATIKTLNKLGMQKFHITRNDVCSLVAFEHLRSLYLHCCEIDETALTALSECHTLRSLRIESEHSGSVSNLQLAAFPNLKSLHLCFIDQSDKHFFRKLFAASSKLNELRVEDSSVVDDDILGFSEDTNIRSLSVSGNEITNLGLKYLSKLTKLEELDVSDNSITDQGLESLSSLTKLKALKIRSNKNVLGEGLRCCREMPYLEHLDLSGTRLSSSAWKEIALLKKLKFLRIDSNSVREVSPELFKRIDEAIPKVIVNIDYKGEEEYYTEWIKE